MKTLLTALWAIVCQFIPLHEIKHSDLKSDIQKRTFYEYAKRNPLAFYHVNSTNLAKILSHKKCPRIKQKKPILLPKIQEVGVQIFGHS